MYMYQLSAQCLCPFMMMGKSSTTSGHQIGVLYGLQHVCFISHSEIQLRSLLNYLQRNEMKFRNMRTQGHRKQVLQRLLKFIVLLQSNFQD